MAIQGKITSLYADKTMSEALLPRTNTKAVTDDKGVNLNAILNQVAYIDTENSEAAVAPLNADTLAGFPADNYASKTYVSSEIAKAQLGGGNGEGNIDLSGFATKDDISVLATKEELNAIDFPVDSINGKTGAVQLTAADVDARPNTWMPTASDVGAAPASHASNKSNPHDVTAAQVGARPDTWIPTATELGFTGAVSTILSNNFATSRALVSNSSGKAASSSVTSTELGYLDGVTSSIQTQLNDRLQLTIGTAIASGSDLNTFKTPGKYYSGAGSVSETLTNAPSTSTGFGLIVTDGYIDGRVYQIALMSNTSIRFRYYNGSAWADWRTVLTNVLTSNTYGTSLPEAGTAGRIFFKKVSS